MTVQQQKEEAISNMFPYNPVICTPKKQGVLNISHTVYPIVKNIFTLSDWERLQEFNPILYSSLLKSARKRKSLNKLN